MIQRMFVTIDTKKTNYKNVGKINHGDDLILELTVLSDGDMISFNDPMVDLLVKKSDGKMIRQNSGIEYIQPNKFIIEVKKDCVTSPGLATNQLIINDNGRISTCMFYYTILNSLEEDVIQSISSVEVLEQLDEYVIEARERMELLNDNIKELEELFGATSDKLVEAEMIRNEAEQNRVQSEILRVNNENDRIEADNIRNQNEVDRSSSELVREQRESERILNEEERRQNESERMIDENARQSNESIRMINETDRKTQENRRVTAEINRVNAETTRRNNENSRISNEIERQKTIKEMKSLLEDAREFDERVGVIEDDIEEINSSLDNIENEIEELKQSGGGGGDIDLSDYAKKSDLEVKADKSYVDSAIESVDVSSQLANYATKTELGNKVDKIDGKGLSTNDYTTEEKNKLSGLTNYTHPTSHSATMITEDSTHRFVTDSEKSSWSNKSNLTLGTTSATAFRGDFGNTAYTHSQSAHAPSNAQKNSDITKSEIETKLVGDVTSHTHSQYLTTHQDLSAYATKTEVSQLSDKINAYTTNGTHVPNYWISELDSKVNDIQVAMEKAGRNKSAFLWYTDAHWVNGNSKVSPLLLNYLYMNTPMNKVNFGGDIIGDTLLATREEMKYLYDWRKAIKDLPNHHSVFGNHDMFDLASVDYENDNYRYSFLLASEETSDQVWGNGNYYYIDNPSEKTRYLYIAYMTSDHTEMMEQGQFICEALKSVNDGWHIVAIAHRWWQYSSSSTPTTGSIPAYETEILDVFDKYNARATISGSNYFTTQDFTSGKGKVEFCIGGHIHVDYDIFSNGGIPIIITTADTNQNRVPTSTVDSGTIGTTTESAVFGIIADYNEEVTKITVVGVGRGTSRVVRASNVQPQSISNIAYSGDTTVESTIDKSKFVFTINYSDGTTSSVNGVNSVTPTTIATVGNNLVTITYVENGITLSATTTIVGTAKPTINLFDKNDSDLVDTGRFNSSKNAVSHQQGQLVTGFIECQIGDTFTIESDKSQLTNGYTGTVMLYNASKTAITPLINQAIGDGGWEWSSDNLNGTITIPSSYSNVSHEGTTFVRFCIAYTDIDNIVITKS